MILSFLRNDHELVHIVMYGNVMLMTMPATQRLVW